MKTTITLIILLLSLANVVNSIYYDDSQLYNKINFCDDGLCWMKCRGQGCTYGGCDKSTDMCMCHNCVDSSKWIRSLDTKN